MLDSALALLEQYEDALVMLGAISAVIFVITLLLTPYLLGMIPQDYFSADQHQSLEINNALDLIILLVRTAIGLVLLIAGIIMLVTPGQGLISILLGLFLMEFPGKRNLELKLINHNPTYKTLNWLRNKAKKPPFKR